MVSSANLHIFFVSGGIVVGAIVTDEIVEGAIVAGEIVERAK